MIEKFAKYFPVLLLLFAFCACGSRTSSNEYELKLTVNGLKIDTATVLVYEPEYNHMRVLAAGKLKKGEIVFRGQLDEPHIVIMKFGQKDNPLYFILEQGENEIYIDKKNVVITGGPVNHEYMAKVQLLKSLMKQKSQQWNSYASMMADSSLTQKLETKFYTTDSVLRDSIQNMCLHTMKRNDAVGILFKDRFFHQLDSAHVTLLAGK